MTDATTRALMAELAASGLGSAPVHRGSPEAIGDGSDRPAPAHRALRAALTEGPLTIVALGPATNMASALKDRPDLQARATRIVAVMGRRRGHLFHPVEGGTARTLLGHGPVFTDFNFEQDERAATALLSMRLPLTLIPYEAARDVAIGADMLDAMATRGGAWAWVARRSRAWLGYWRDDINRAGFYPFDLIAAAYASDPSLLRCANVQASIGDDMGILGWFGSDGLFVTPADDGAARGKTTPALYCPEVKRGLKGPALGLPTGQAG